MGWKSFERPVLPLCRESHLTAGTDGFVRITVRQGLARSLQPGGGTRRDLDMPASPPKGLVTLTWDGTNQKGENCASGLCLLRLTAD